MQHKPPLFYASRTDGLGGRLRAILNARVVAEHFGGRFGFLWGDMTKGTDLSHHGVGPVSDTFAPDFIAAHHLDDGHMAGVQTMQLGDAMRAQAQVGAFPPEAEAINVGQVDLSFQGMVFPAGMDRSALVRKAWDDLQFSPTLEGARHLAGTLAFPARATAIHLRSGDIVYGHYRLSDRFHHKVCAYPLVEEIIRNQISEGFTPVLFGQDPALCRYLRDRHGALLATDLSVGQGFDKNQHAISDIVMMSRCERIFAGESGFAILAASIAGVKRSKPLVGTRRNEKVALIETAIFDDEVSADVAPLQRAFACRNAFVISGIHFPTEPRFQRLLNHAREMDPENDFYHFVQAVASYVAGDGKTGEEIIGALLLGKRRFLYPLLKKQKDKAGYEVDPYLPILTQQAERGFANAASFVSRAYEFRGDPKQAAHFAALFETLTSAALVTAGRLNGIQAPTAEPAPAKSDPGRKAGGVLSHLLDRIRGRGRSG